MTIPSSLSRSKFTIFWAWRRASAVLGPLLSYLIKTPSAITAANKRSVVLVFILLGGTCFRASQIFHRRGENADMRPPARKSRFGGGAKNVPAVDRSRCFSCSALPPDDKPQRCRDERHQ